VAAVESWLCDTNAPRSSGCGVGWEGFKSLDIDDDCANIRVSLPNITGGALPNNPAYFVVSAWE
jgi:hypothetical protein